MANTETKIISILDPQSISDVQRIMNDLWEQAQYDEYYDMFRDMERAVKNHSRELESQYPLILQRYQILMNTARWRVFNRLTIDEIETLFFTAAEGIAELSLDEILNSIRFALMVEPVRENRDTLKQRLRDALARAESQIGQTKIQLVDTLVEPSVKNWIKDWKIFLGDRQPTSLLLVEYLNTSPNILQLPKETIEPVQKIFKLYVELLKSSTTPEGAEELFAVANSDSGTYQLFEKGHLIDSGIAIPQDQLSTLRADRGLDPSGKPLPISTLFHMTDIFQQYAQAVIARAGQDKGTVTPRRSAESDAAKKIIRNEEIVKDSLPQSKPIPQPTIQSSVPAAPTVSSQTPRPRVFAAKAVVPSPVPQSKSPVSIQKNISPSEMSPKEMAQYVLHETGLLLPSIALEQRFLSIASSYFEKKIDAELFMKELIQVPELGGVGLTQAEVQRLLVVAQRIQESDFAIPRVPRPMPKPKVSAPSLDSLHKAMQTAQQSKPVEAASPQPKVEDIFGNIDSVPVSGMSTWNASRTQTSSASKRGVTREPLSVHDNQGAVLMGPLDELRAMQVAEFRRLSADPAVAARYILNQLSVLEEESVSQKAAGIEAWTQSPLNQLYLRIGRESLDRMMSVEDVIQAQTERKEETLSVAEFQAISDLNRTLRF